MSVTLGPDSFTVTKATLTASIVKPNSVRPDGTLEQGLSWNMALYAVATDEHEGRSFSTDISFVAHSLPLQQQTKHWIDLVGQVITWDGLNQGEVAQVEAALHWVYWEDIQHSTLRFVDRDGCRFKVSWDGITSCNQLTLSINTWVDFAGVDVDRELSDMRTMEEILAQYFDPSDFTLQPSAIPPQKWAFFEPRI